MWRSQNQQAVHHLDNNVCEARGEGGGVSVCFDFLWMWRSQDQQGFNDRRLRCRCHARDPGDCCIMKERESEVGRGEERRGREGGRREGESET